MRKRSFRCYFSAEEATTASAPALESRFLASLPQGAPRRGGQEVGIAHWTDRVGGLLFLLQHRELVDVVDMGPVSRAGRTGPVFHRPARPSRPAD